MRARLSLLLVLLALAGGGQAQSSDGRARPAPGGKRWAVVVGISQYKFLPAQQQLKYAARDAESFAAFLRSPEGGSFDEQSLRVLLDESATARNIRSALGTWLPSKVAESDLVIIYFAGHGVVTESQGGPYLVPHDAEPQDLYATALPLEAVASLLQKRIPARQVVVLADANHVAQLGGAAAGPASGQNQINQLIGRLAGDRPGVFTITANRAGEPSAVADKLGGGHGVFTYYLVEALKGAANSDGDSVVQADEAFRYLAAAVSRETGGAQHPQQTGRPGDRLSLARVTRLPERRESVAAAPPTERRPSPPARGPRTGPKDEGGVARRGSESTATRPPAPAPESPRTSRGRANPAETATATPDLPKTENTPAATRPPADRPRASSPPARAEDNNIAPPPPPKSTTLPKSGRVEVGRAEMPLPRTSVPPVETAPPPGAAPLPPVVASFYSAIEAGSLLEPRGRSAWDYYLEMVKGDPNRPELASFKARLADALAAEGERVMARLLEPTAAEPSLEDYQRASTSFAKAYQLRPDNQRLNALQRVSEGQSLILLQRYEEAQKVLQKAVELAADSALAHQALGVAFREQQRHFLAEREFKRAIELAPGSFFPRYNLALTYEAGKSEDDAIREYLAALALDEKQPVVLARLGNLYLAQKKYAEAAAALEKSVALKPNSELYNKLGNAYFGLGRQEDATRAYRLARETRPKQ